MNIRLKSEIDPVRHPALSGLPGIRHAFFTRHGGVSKGIYEGLNAGLGSDDDRAAVMENRARIASHMGVAPGDLFGVHQIHSPDVVIATQPLAGDRPKADACVTAVPGLVVSVLTADCGPVLFADPKARVVGAAHAGWKGAFTGVLENTIAAMEGLGAKRSDIIAILGPSISQANYETGPEFEARFREADPALARWFTPSDRAEHFMFDLTGYIVDRLEKAGVKAAATGDCTYADEAAFYSYRRTTHRKEPDYGRQMSAICLTD